MHVKEIMRKSSEARVQFIQCACLDTVRTPSNVYDIVYEVLIALFKI